MAKATADENDFVLELLQLQPEDIVELARDAGFQALDLRRHTRGDRRFSFVIGTRVQDKGPAKQGRH
jgi:hypothetical protein